MKISIIWKNLSSAMAAEEIADSPALIPPSSLAAWVLIRSLSKLSYRARRLSKMTMLFDVEVETPADLPWHSCCSSWFVERPAVMNPEPAVSRLWRNAALVIKR